MVRAMDPGDPNPKLLVRALDEDIVVPLNVLEKWFVDYQAGTYRISLRDPDDECRRRGAVGLLILSPQSK